MWTETSGRSLLIVLLSATRVSIGPVAATVGIFFWGWLWGVMGLLLAAAHGIRHAHHGFASILKSLIQRARTGASSDSTLGAIRRNGFAPGDSLLARLPGSQTWRKRFTGWR
jgi:hypothetical protein